MYWPPLEQRSSQRLAEYLASLSTSITFIKIAIFFFEFFFIIISLRDDIKIGSYIQLMIFNKRCSSHSLIVSLLKFIIRSVRPIWETPIFFLHTSSQFEMCYTSYFYHSPVLPLLKIIIRSVKLIWEPYMDSTDSIGTFKSWKMEKWHKVEMNQFQIVMSALLETK
jgi:hypothetical protein